MKVFAHGRALDATFTLEPGHPEVMLVFESRSGKRGTPSARNSEYERGLEVLLERLKQSRIHIKAIRLHPANGKLGSALDLGRYGPPVLLHNADDAHDVRLAITKAQPGIDRQPGARGGGNPTRRLRIYLSADAAKTDIAKLERQLAGTEPLDSNNESSARISLEQALDVIAKASGAPSASPARSRGQGFGLTQPERHAVDRHAMAVATQYFESLGYTVADTSNGNCFDLACSKTEETELRVEVKGTTGEGEAVRLTRNEVEHARERHPHIALAVVSGIQLTRGATAPVASGGTLRVLNPWRLDDGTLTAFAFEYDLPPAEQSGRTSARVTR